MNQMATREPQAKQHSTHWILKPNRLPNTLFISQSNKRVEHRSEEQTELEKDKYSCKKWDQRQTQKNRYGCVKKKSHLISV